MEKPNLDGNVNGYTCTPYEVRVVRNRCAAAAFRIKTISFALGGYSPNLKTLRNDFFDNCINLSF